MAIHLTPENSLDWLCCWKSLMTPVSPMMMMEHDPILSWSFGGSPGPVCSLVEDFEAPVCAHGAWRIDDGDGWCWFV